MFNPIPNNKLALAPELSVGDWFNTAKPITLQELQGNIVILHAFQMLCPGCVSHGIPQAKQLHEFYRNDPVQIIGLHSVFEHHRAMQNHALEAFIHEYKITFPVAVDRESGHGPIPETMQSLALRGTPSLIIIDQFGRIRMHHFGHIDNLAIGNLVGTLLAGNPNDTEKEKDLSMETANIEGRCDESGCAI